MANVRELNANLIALYMTSMMENLTEKGEEVMQIASGQFCFPVVDADQNDKWLRVTISVPTGSKDEPFDGYTRRDSYEIDLHTKEEKAKVKAEEKARKMARDKAMREAKKAEREKAKVEKGE